MQQTVDIPITAELLLKNGFKRNGFTEIYSYQNNCDVSIDLDRKEARVRSKSCNIEFYEINNFDELLTALKLAKVNKKFNFLN